MALENPSKHFGRTALPTRTISPADLVRVSRFNTSEPYFGKSGGNRFDDPRGKVRYGTCYFGFDLPCAFAETVLHDEIFNHELGGFPLVRTELDRYVLSFTGNPLTVAILSGIELKTLGGDGALSTIMPYAIPQQWSLAVHAHTQNVDGFLYMSRHINTAEALVLFDRAQSKLTLANATPLTEHPATERVLQDFKILLR